MSKLPIFGLFLSVGNLSWVFSRFFSWFFSRVFFYWIRPQFSGKTYVYTIRPCPSSWPLAPAPPSPRSGSGWPPPHPSGRTRSWSAGPRAPRPVINNAFTAFMYTFTQFTAIMYCFYSIYCINLPTFTAFTVFTDLLAFGAEVAAELGNCLLHLRWFF